MVKYKKVFDLDVFFCMIDLYNYLKLIELNNFDLIIEF